MNRRKTPTSNRFPNLNQPKIYIQMDLLTAQIPMYQEIQNYPKNSSQHKAFLELSNLYCKMVFENMKALYDYKIIFPRLAGQNIEADAIDVTALAIQELDRISFAVSA